MARPKKQTVDYFPHDTDASDKKTLTILQSKHGNDGYAFWFKLLEMLGDTPGHAIDFNDETTWEFLQAKTLLSEGFCTEILDLLAKLQAIDRELWAKRRIVWCQNLVDRVADVYRNRKLSVPERPSFYDDKPPDADVSTDDNPQIESKKKVNKKEIDKEKEMSSSSSSGDDDLSIAALYEQEIGKITPSVADELRGAGKEYPPDWIRDAIREAALAGVKKWRYIEAILDNWKQEGKGTGKNKDSPPAGHGKGRLASDPNKYRKGRYGHMVQY
jgi:DnaD/phage-associated family protein